MQQELKEINFIGEQEEILEMPVHKYFMPKLPRILPNSEEPLQLLCSERTNNFLTTAFSILSKYPQYIFHVFNTEKVQTNKYKIKLNILGDKLYLDVPGDIILSQNNKNGNINPLFTKHNDTFLFNYILEKARTLLYDSYIANIIGNPFEVVQEVYGGFYKVYNLKNNMKVLTSIFMDKFYNNGNDLNKVGTGSYFTIDFQNFEKRIILIKEIVCMENYHQLIENRQKRVQNYSFEIIDARILDDEHETKKIILNLQINSLQEYKYLLQIADIKNSFGLSENDNDKNRPNSSYSKLQSINEFRDNDKNDNEFPPSMLVDYNKIKNIFKYFSVNYFKPIVTPKYSYELKQNNTFDENLKNQNIGIKKYLGFNKNNEKSKNFNFMGKVDDYVHYRVFTFEITRNSSINVNIMEKSFMYFMKCVKKHNYNDIRITLFDLQPANINSYTNDDANKILIPMIIRSIDKFDEKLAIKSFETHLNPGLYAFAIEIVIKNEFPVYSINFELNEHYFKTFNYIGDLYAYDLMFLYSYINDDKSFYDKLILLDVNHSSSNKQLKEERRLILQAIKENMCRKNDKKILRQTSSVIDSDSPMTYGYSIVSKNIYLLYFEKNNLYKKVGVKLNKKVFKCFNIFFSYNLFEGHDISLNDNCTFYLTNKIPISIFILKTYEENLDDQILSIFIKKVKGYKDNTEKVNDKPIKQDIEGFQELVELNPKFIRYKSKEYETKTKDEKNISNIVNEELDIKEPEVMINNFIAKNQTKKEHQTVEISSYRRGGTRNNTLIKGIINKSIFDLNQADQQNNNKDQSIQEVKEYKKKVSFDFSKFAKNHSSSRTMSQSYDPNKKPIKGILNLKKSKFNVNNKNELSIDKQSEKNTKNLPESPQNRKENKYTKKYFNFLINQCFISKSFFYYNHNHSKIDIRNQFLKKMYFNITNNIVRKDSNGQFLKFNDQRQTKELTDEDLIDISKKYGTKISKNKDGKPTDICEYYTGNENFMLIYIENNENNFILREERLFKLENLQLEPNEIFRFMQNNYVYYEVLPTKAILLKLSIVYKHKSYRFDFDVAYDLINI